MSDEPKNVLGESSSGYVDFEKVSLFLLPSDFTKETRDIRTNHFMMVSWNRN